MAPGSSGRRPKVVLDTSFLISVMEHPTTWREDILERVGAHTLVVLGSVRGELERLKGEKSKRGKFASLALSLSECGDLLVEGGGGEGGNPDDEIISYALKERAIVATMDAELAGRLRASGIRTITLRGGRVWSE